MLNVRPYQLICLFCRMGRRDACVAYYHAARLDEIQAAVEQDPVVPITLRCNTDSIYRCQNPGREYDTPEGDDYNDLRDLAVLRKLGLVPGATRSAVDLMERLIKAIPACSGICAYPEAEAPGWPACRLAGTGNYERGVAQGVGAVFRRRAASEKQALKQASGQVCYTAERLRIRPHHLLCMACFHAGRSQDALAPIAEDNLFECIEVMQKNPEMLVELIAGPCMICPPCSRYDRSTNLCLGGQSMGLRDQKKDLDTLRRTGLRYGDVLPAHQLLSKVYAAVPSTRDVCGSGDGPLRSPEWDGCGRLGNDDYLKGRAAGLGVPGVAVEDGTARSSFKILRENGGSGTQPSKHKKE